MNNNIYITIPCPKLRANIFSRLTFRWLLGTFCKCIKEGLQVCHLYENMPNDKSKKLCDSLEKNWNVELERVNNESHKPSLLRAIRKTFFWSFVFDGLQFFLYYVILRVMQSQFLATFIGLFSKHENATEPIGQNVNAMYLYGGLILFDSIILTFFQHVALSLSVLGARVRIACCSLIYRKMLRLSKTSLSSSVSGHIINLLSNDVSRFDSCFPFAHMLWVIPLQVTLMTYLIWQQVEISALIGVSVLIIAAIPVIVFLAKLSYKLRLKIATKTDVRVKKMTEIISGIRTIKMFAWEKPFANIVSMTRISEIHIISWSHYVQGIIASSAYFMEKIALGVTVLTYATFGHVLTAEKLFSVTFLFFMVQQALAIHGRISVSTGAEILATIKRLQQYLLLEERDNSSIKQTTTKSVVFRNVCVSWDNKSQLLSDVTAIVPPGSLCAIVGPVGAGKSTIFQLLLGELVPQHGTIEIGGGISYSSQEPWLFSSTVRNNILFGQKYDHERYERVIKSCALERDLQALAYGDKSLVGENGVILSGGQKARVNLARSVYRNADIYLLDDPLSAVDPHVGTHLFEECILGHLKNKTRILVTHQLQYLQKADHILVINNGKIEAQGTFGDVIKSNSEFSKLLVRIRKDSIERESSKCKEAHNEIRPPVKDGNVENDLPRNEEKPPLQLGLRAYREYVRAGGNAFTLFGLLFCLVLTQVLQNSIDLWGTYWTKNEGCKSAWKSNNSAATVELTLIQKENYGGSKYMYETDSGSQSTERTEMCYDWFDMNLTINVYVGLIVSFVLMTIVKTLYLFKVAVNASRNLHNKMFSSLLQFPVRYFDINPSGRILNRFSSDMGIIDEVLPQLIFETLSRMFVATGILLMIFISNPYMIVIVVLLATVIYKMQGWYLRIAVNLKHLEAILRSPVFTHISDSLHGIDTVRASSTESILIEEFDQHQDTHTSAWHLMLCATVSFSWLIELIVAVLIACITISFIITNHFVAVNSSLVGLAVSQSLLLTGQLQFGMRQAAEMVSKMTSVERVLEYTTLDKEGLQETNTDVLLRYDDLDKQFFTNWPNKGAIKFNHIYLRYSNEEGPVLKDVNFTIEVGEKIGIVGRTGAGKSSLVAALFRLVSTYEGFITIDNVRTDLIGLNDLRKKISIIPQDPVLFSGTLRYNLDPFEEYSDKELWNALDTVQLKDVIDTLDFAVEDSGKTFSVGQKQLVCLARAILKSNKILVLDEATANVDPITDALIQETIRRKFNECTVLTIAHRLHTVMDSDKIMVMDRGQLVEFDSPYQLLQNVNGYLYKMVAQTDTMSGELFKIAREAFYKSQTHESSYL